MSEEGGLDHVAATDEGERTLTVPADASAFEFSVPTQGNDRDESGGGVTVTLVADGCCRIGTGAALTVAVRDDDATKLAVTRIDGSDPLYEDGGTATVTFALARALGAGDTVTIPLSLSGATVPTHATLAAKAGQTGVKLLAAAPWSAAQPALEITGAGVSEGVIEITAVDNADNVKRTLRIGVDGSAVTAAGPGLDGGVAFSGKAVDIVIADNDGTPQLSVEAEEDPTDPGVDEGRTARFFLRADPSPKQDLPVKLDVRQQGDVIESVGAFGPVSSNVLRSAGTLSLTIPARHTGRIEITVQTRGDGVDEPDGWISIGEQGGDAAARLDVWDNDGGHTVGLSGTAVPVTEGGTARFTIEMSDRGADHSPELPRVNLRVSQVGDFAAPGETGVKRLQFVDGNGNQVSTIVHEVRTVDDSVDERDGRIIVELLPCSRHNGQSTCAVRLPPDDERSVTVRDDDPDAAKVNVQGLPLSLSEAKSGSGKYEVSLQTDPGQAVTVRADVPAAHRDAVSVMAPGGTAGASATLSFTGGASGNWGTPQTVTVAALDDGDGDDETVVIAHAVTGYPGVASAPGFSVEVKDSGHGLAVERDDVRVRENGGTANYRLRLRSRPSAEVTVTPVSADTERATVSGPLTFAPAGWNAWRTVTVTGLKEGDVRVSHRTVSTDKGYDGLPDGAAGVDVTVGADPRPVASLTAAPNPVAEGADLTLTATLDRAVSPGKAVTIPLAYTYGTASSADISEAASITIASGARRGSATVATVDDTEHEATAETFAVAFGTLPDEVQPGTASVEVAIDDAGDAPRTATLAVSSKTVAEGGEVTVTVSLDKALDSPARAVTIPLAYTLGDTEAADLTQLAEVVIASGGTAGTGKIVIADDAVHEPEETFTVALGATLPEGISAGETAEAEVTVARDAADRPSVSVDPAQTRLAGQHRHVDVGEGAGTLEIRLVRTGDTELPVSGIVFYSDGAKAKKGSEYKETTKTWSLAASDASIAIPVEITADNDDDPVPEERSFTMLFAVTNGEADHGDIRQVRVSILDDDPTLVTLAPGKDVTLGEGDAANSGTATLSLSRRLAADEVVEIPLVLTTSTGATLPGADAPDFTVSLAGALAGPQGAASLSGGTTATPTVTLKGRAGVTVRSVDVAFAATARDDGDLADETFKVALGDLSGKTLATNAEGGAAAAKGDNAATFTIVDDDEEPTGFALSVDAGTVAEDVSSAPTVTVTATAVGGTAFAEEHDIAVTVGAPGDTASAPADYAEVTGFTITVPANQAGASGTFVLTPADDAVDEADETVTVTGVSGDLDVRPATVTIADDDPTPVALSVPDGTASEGRASDTARIELALGRGLVAGESLSVPLAFAGGTAGTHFTLALSGTPKGVSLSGTTVTFTGAESGTTAATAAVLLTASEDADTTDDTVTVSIPASSAGNAPVLGAKGLGGGATGSRTGDGTVTLKDSAVPGVSVTETGSVTAVTEASGAGNRDTYGLVLTAEPTQDVTVTVTAPDGLQVDGPDAATAGSSTETLTFTDATWDKAQTVTVSGVDDAVDHGTSRDLEITHAVASADARYQGIDVDGVTVTVTDDDDAPGAITLSADADTVAPGTQARIAEDGGARTVRVTATVDGATRFGETKSVTVKVGKSGDGATEGTDYGTVADQTITIPAGAGSAHADFRISPTDDSAAEGDETVSIEGELAGVTFVNTFVTIDDDRPTVAVSDVPERINSRDPFTAKFTFSEAVTGFDVTDVTVTGGTKAASVSGGGTTYTLAITPSGDADVVVTVAEDAATDGATNTGPAQAVSATASWDATAPTVAIGGVPERINSTAKLDVTFTFSEDVTGFVADDVSVSGGTAGTFSGSGKSYSLKVTPEGSKDVVVTVAKDAATDSAANTGPAQAVSATASWDATAPTVAIGGVPERIGSTADLDVTFTFSEDVTGFVADDVSVSGGTAGTFSGSGKSYSLKVTPEGSKDVVVSVVADAATDGANTGPASVVSATAAWDSAAPKVTITDVPARINSRDPFTAKFTFSEAVTGFDATDVTVEGGKKAASVSGSGTTYTLAITPSGDADVVVTVAKDAATDGATNTGPAQAVSATASWDAAAPTVAIGGVPERIGSTADLDVTFTFSEAVTGFDVTDVTVTGGTKAASVSGSGTTYTLAITPSGDADVVVTVAKDAATDSATNTGPAQAVSATASWDATAPTVEIGGVPERINSTADLDVTFTFSEDVTGFVADDVSVSGGTAGTFRAVSGTEYTLQVTPEGSKDVVVSVVADAATDGANTGPASVVSATAAWDSAAPTVTITDVPARINSRDPFTAKFTFSEAVTGFDVTDVTVTGGTKAASVSGGGTTYTLAITPSGDADVVVTVAKDAATDGATNTGPAQAVSATSTWDGTAPTVTITDVPERVNSRDPFTATFAFSEAVTGFDVADVTVTGGTKAASVSGSGTTYTLAITPSGDADVVVTVAKDAATDSAANTGPAKAVSATASWDGTVPTVAIGGVPERIGSTADLDVTFTFSEAVTGFDVTDVTVTGGTKAASVSGSGTTYTLAITPSGDADVVVTVAKDAATDSATNTGPAQAVSATASWDATAPTVEIGGVPERINSTAKLDVTFTFSEDVTGFVADDVSVSGGTAGTFRAVSGTEYTLQVTPEGSKDVVVSVVADAATDGANTGPASVVSATAAWDSAAPTVTITDVPARINSRDPFTAKFTFSEAVTGFDVTDVTVTGGTKAASVSGSGTAYTLVVTPSGDADVVVTVTADAATDRAANTGPAQAVSATSTWDGTAPTVTITDVPERVNSRDPFTATFAFSEAVTGFDVADVTVTGGTKAASVSGSGTTYTLAITPSGDADVVVTVAKDAATDSATNAGPAQAVSATASWDATAPTVAIGGVPERINSTAKLDVTFTFSEDVTGFDATDVSVSGGTAGTFRAVSGTEYTLQVTPEGSKDVVVSVVADAATDGANTGPASVVSATAAWDSAAPTVTITDVPERVNSRDPFTATFAFSEAVTGFDVADVTVTGGTKAASVSGSGTTYTLAITPSGDADVVVTVAKDAATDGAANTGPAQAVSATASWDGTVPTVAIGGVPERINSTAKLDVTFTFSEDVTGFDATDVSVSGGTAGTFRAVSGTEYTLLVTPEGSKDVVVTVAKDAATDGVNTGPAQAVTATATWDGTVPTVVIGGVPERIGSTADLDVTFTFSEAVTGFDVTDVTVTGGTKAASVSGSGTTYTLAITPSGDADVVVTVAKDAATDGVNAGPAQAVSATASWDAAAPTVAIGGVPERINSTADLDVTFTFSEDVTGFVADDVSVSGATAGTFRAVSGTEYTLLVTPEGSKDVVVTVAADAATDGATNTGPAQAVSATASWDGTVPTVAIGGVPERIGSTADLDVTFTFSEDVTGFVADDVSVSGGTAGTFSGSGKSYSLKVTPEGSKDVVVSVVADAATDGANTGPASVVSATAAWDSAAPTVEIGGVPERIGSTAELDVTFTFSEDVTDFDASDVSVSGGTAGTFSGSGKVYALQVTPEGSKDVVVTVAADVATDGVNAGPAQAVTATATWDAAAPTVAIGGVPERINSTAELDVTFTFSEAVTGFDVTDVTVEGGTKAASVSGSGTTYTLAITPSGDADVVVTVAKDAATDSATNAGPAQAVSATASWDAAAPTVAIGGVPERINSTADLDVTFTFSEDVTEFTADDVSVSGGTAGTFRAVSGTEYTLLVTPEGSKDVVVTVAKDAASDGVNTGPAQAVTATASWDAAEAPTVAIGGVPERINSRAAFTATFTFSEDVTGFDASDVTVTGGAKRKFSGGGRRYTLKVKPDGSTDVEIAVTMDGGVNDGTASAATAAWDATAPSVEIGGVPERIGSTAELDVTFTFSEAVTGFDITDVTVTGGTKGTFGTTDARTYTLQVMPDGLRDVTVEVAADAATDGMNTGPATPATATATWGADAPTVEITDVPESVHSRDTFTARFTFSKDVTGFDASDVTVTGGAKRKFSGGGRNYALKVKPDGSGDVVVTVAANAATGGLDRGPAAAVTATAVWDPAGVVLSTSALEIPEGGSGTYTVALATRPWSTVTVTAKAPDGLLVDGPDDDTSGTARETLTFTFRDWDQAQTVTVFGVNDEEYLGASRELSVAHTASSGDSRYDGVAIGGMTATVTDDDAPATASPIAQCASFLPGRAVSVAEVEGWRDENIRNVSVTNARRWERVLAALDPSAGAGEPMAASEAQAYADEGWTRWRRAAATLRAIEECLGTLPEISIAGPPDRQTVADGTAVRFTLTATRATSVPVSVNVSVADAPGSDFLAPAEEGARQVTMPAGETGTSFTVATVDDRLFEPDGRVTARLSSGSGYRVAAAPGDEAGARIVNDDPRALLFSFDFRDGLVLSESDDGGTEARENETTYKVSLDARPTGDVTVTMTAPEDAPVTVEPASLTFTPSDHDTAQTVTVTALDDAVYNAGGARRTKLRHKVRGGGYGKNVDMRVTVRDDGDTTEPDYTDYRTVVKLLVQERDHPANAAVDGNPAHVAKWNQVLAAIGHDSPEAPMAASRIHANAGKWPDSPFRAASVYLKSQDPELQQDGLRDPVITVSAGDAVTEGESAVFTFTATPPPAADLPVSAGVTGTGDFGVTTSAQTVTIPTTGSATLTLATEDDDANEADGSVTVFVRDGEGYVRSSPSADRVTVRDDDGPVVTISAGEAVTEGGSAIFTLTADPAPTSPLAVTVSVWTAGAYGVTARLRTVTIPATGSAALTLATKDDDRDESDGSVTVNVQDGDFYTVGTSASGTVAIRDDDLPSPVVTITAKAASVTEGEDAVFTVTADRAPEADLQVRVQVSETGDGDHVAAADEDFATVTIAKGHREADFSVATVNDDVDEPDTSVAVTVKRVRGYRDFVLGDPASGTVTVNDDDATQLPVLTVADVTVREGVEWLMTFTVRLSEPVRHRAHVSVSTGPSFPESAQAPADYSPVYGRQLTFLPGETEKAVEVVVHDDSHDEGTETFELWLSDPVGATIGDGIAVGTIENDDPMPAAFLARFGRTVAQQALDGIVARIDAPRVPGLDATLAGQTLGTGDSSSGMTPSERKAAAAGRRAEEAMAELARAIVADADGTDGAFGGDMAAAEPRFVGDAEALLGTAFTLTTARDGAGGTTAFWGRAARAGFEGSEGAFSLDGAATTVTLGADHARGRWIAGLALLRSVGSGDYRDTDIAPRPPGQACPGGAGPLCNGAVRAGDGAVEATLSAAVPYAVYHSSDSLSLWGALGRGTGGVTLETAMGGVHAADTDWSMAAAGLRGKFLGSGGSGPALAVTSDGLWTRTSSERTRDLAASESVASRLRLGLDGRWTLPLDGGGSLEPRFEIGLRRDGGDAESGFGIEAGGGMAWTAPSRGLSLDVSGRRLFAHEDGDLKDWGVSASLTWDPSPATRRGPTISMRQAWGGSPAGGLDALLVPDALDLDSRIAGDASPRAAFEAAYGLPAFGGRFTGTPHAGCEVSGEARDCTVGWRLGPEAPNAPDVSLGAKATRSEDGTDAPVGSFGIDLTVRW